MKTYLDCYPCFLRQALDAARFAGAGEDQQKVILDRVLETLQQISPSSTPPEIGDRVHRIVRQATGSRDPYREVKKAGTDQALALYPRLKRQIREADDPLDVAIRLSIAGNIIDLGPNQQYDLWAAIERVLSQPFAIDDRERLRGALAAADRVLYLADNAGETVFDRLLIEALDVPALYAVKGGPVLNDATRKDALQAGLAEAAQVIDTGSDAPGTVLERCSVSFQTLYRQAGLIIAKGQANYETLSDRPENVFFLLQLKCPVIARDVGMPVGSIVLQHARNGRT